MVSFDEAWQVLSWWTMLLDGKPPSTNKRAQPSPLSEGARLDWWLAHDGRTPDWRNGRSVAYLCAYIELGRGSIPTTGLVLSQGYIWPDRAVIRALLAADCLVQVDGRFVLTARGEALLAPFLKFDDGELAITFHSYKDREL